MILKDNFNRKVDYLRISLTDRCNLRCFYCSPSPLKLFAREEILTLEEIEAIVVLFYEEFGIKKFRLTGGEPLMRKNIEKLIANIKTKMPSVDLNITTNALLLHSKIDFLKNYDVKINISLDTLNGEKFRKITGVDELNKVLNTIETALKRGLNVKINTVLLKGVNDNEALDLIQFASKIGVPIRFIEVMPFFENWQRYFISAYKLLDKIREKFDIHPIIDESSVADYYILSPGNVKVGVIPTISSPFCMSCSRVRLTSTGDLILCMFDSISYSIKKFLRPRFEKEMLTNFIAEVVKNKPQGIIAMKEKKAFHTMVKLGG